MVDLAKTSTVTTWESVAYVTFSFVPGLRSRATKKSRINQLEVKYIDHMGTDLSVVNAARVSFNKKSESFY